MKISRLKKPVRFVLRVLCCVSISAGCPGANAPTRGVRLQAVQPVPNASRGSAGMFIGVNTFRDSSVQPLRFAVNDAVAQAHLFVSELKLITPDNAVLILAGTPNNPATVAQLQELKQSGVRVEDALRSQMLGDLLWVAGRASSKEDLLIVSISTHGFEENAVPFILPTDGLLAALSESGLSLKYIEGRLADSKAGTRLLIVDACRERPTVGTKSVGQTMQTAWREALSQSYGQAALMSCDVGQFSYEDPALGHGVFTHHLLAALGGNAPADANGFITLGSVCDYVSTSVNDWVKQNRPGTGGATAQKPWFQGSIEAKNIPLAISTSVAVAQRELVDRKRKAGDILMDARKANPDLIALRAIEDIEGAMKRDEGESLIELLEQIEELKDIRPTRVKSFLAWWSIRGGGVPTSAAEQPVYESEATGLRILTATTLSDAGITKEQLLTEMTKLNRDRCLSNLFHIGMVARGWAEEHDKAFPYSYTQLDGRLALDAMICPADQLRTTVASIATMDTSRDTSYPFLAAGLPLSGDPKRVLTRCALHQCEVLVSGVVVANPPARYKSPPLPVPMFEWIAENLGKAASTARKNACIANLKQIDGATQQWALENKKVSTDQVVVSAITEYLRGNKLPDCPGGGVYKLTTVDVSPTCTIPGHTLDLAVAYTEASTRLDRKFGVGLEWMAKNGSCRDNLRQMDGALAQWALENKKQETDTYTLNDLREYLKGSKLPTCPYGGQYSVGKNIGESPHCSIPGHTIDSDSSESLSSGPIFDGLPGIPMDAQLEASKCVNNLKQIGMACRIFANDKDDHFPWNVPMSKGGSKESGERDKDGFDVSPFIHFKALGYELGAPKILICPSDRNKTPTDNFLSLKPQNVSYRLRTAPEVDEVNPNEIMVVCPIHGSFVRADGSVVRVSKTQEGNVLDRLKSGQ